MHILKMKKLEGFYAQFENDFPRRLYNAQFENEKA